MLLGCGNTQKPKALVQYIYPKEYTYRIIKEFPHSTDSYTQGLIYEDGVLWEGTGSYGNSFIERINLETSKAERLCSLPKDEFGEGITILNDRIYQLTWVNKKLHIYSKDGKKIKDLQYKGEGWGLTTDGNNIYMSDGTSNIRVMNEEFKVLKTLNVTIGGQSVPYINELEWINGKIWANVYTLNEIIIINPENGVVEGIIHMQNLLPKEEYTDDTDVLNGIAYDKEQNRIFVTGKNWSKLYQIEIVEL